jgi:7-cyano-7-deazaguanine synthase
MKSQKICVLVSGGLDSSILLLMTAKRYREVYPVYIQCGLYWEKTELYWLRKFLRKIRLINVKPLKILKVPVEDLYQRHWSLTGRGIPGLRSRDQEVYLPGRNLLLLSKAAVYCTLQGINKIALGILKRNPFPDSQEHFFRILEKVISIGLVSPVKVFTPFSKMSKSEVLQKAGGIPIELTFSCLKPKGVRACGQCNKCAERKKAVRAV